MEFERIAIDRRVRFVIVSPDLRHNRRRQAEIPLIQVFEFGQPPLSVLAITRAEVGAAFIITPRCASPPTDS